jgi:phosphomannomutase / phosphoglucomutase
VRPEIVVANDYRDYALAVKQALILGLIEAGITVHDIGTALSPMAYFAQFQLDVPAVAMVTASHNPNGWTGVKMGLAPPLTHGPEEMAELREIVLGGLGVARDGGGWRRADVREAYLADLAGDFRLSRPLRVVCATGNGTAGAFAPAVLEAIGAEVIGLHTGLDYTFPHYNPNPEAMEMLHDMAASVRAQGADLALGFDGDGDRCGVVDDEGNEIFADKMGVILARDLAARHPGAVFVADVKSTGLFASDPVLRDLGARTDYWKTGHSHMKRRVKELNALAGFEKSGHYFLAPPVGRGYDCGLRAAVEICRLLDRHPDKRLSDLARELPATFTSPTMSPFCPDAEKYEVSQRITDGLHDCGGPGGAGRAGDHRHRHGERRAGDAGGRKLGVGAPVVQHTKSCGRLRKYRERGASAGDLRRSGRGDQAGAVGGRLRPAPVGQKCDAGIPDIVSTCIHVDPSVYKNQAILVSNCIHVDTIRGFRPVRGQARCRLTRRFWRPFFSILPSRTGPISPVRATWVPPQGCRST